MSRPLLIAALLACTCTAFAQSPEHSSPSADNARHAAALRACGDCGTVQGVHQEKRKGSGGAVGVVGGAVVGGLLGNQIGGGTGKTLATVGGAVAGGYAGNEVQKHVTSKNVWVTKVRMKDGSIHSFEQEAKPSWAAGSVVRVEGHTLRKL
ncbi:glycine zipper 2TM domain-containing protein [Caenimonas aquaedulcis]|uniref:Glycine zipper 2TM domain-containing protein n=1 Tax=Caenimonas aquaedulcis TaxID=2793270 RepID=A0A931MHU4_9BURK|nr:glycine zipper 2TM domain-containing protein [Caenimonas aquaedulcis]MBG9389134.1 glycine zipper 2TM domain-containing protein [Caenimonas aquaedulcis]